MKYESMIEQMIREAMERGEFDNLKGEGEPVDLNTYFAAPEDWRIGFSLMKNAGVVPEEMELLKEVNAMKQELSVCKDEEERRKLKKRIDETMLKYNLLKERYKRQ
ncbi:MAG: DUF1992 domain-containing protein [Pyrinomonadaceae bacterium]